MINKKIALLIPDGECPVSMKVINCLSKVKHFQIYVMSNKKNLYIKYSKHICKFSYYPKTDSQKIFIDNINKETEKYNIDLIMPLFENCIKAILEHKNLITSASKLVHLPSYNNFNTALNKGEFAKHLKKHNIPGPVTQVIKKNNPFNIDETQYPVIVKPTEGNGGRGIHVFKEKVEFKKFLNSDEFNCTYLVQDYIEGYDIDCSVLCIDDKIKAYTIQKANLHSKHEFGPQHGVEFLWDDTLFNIVKNLMKSLNWSGIAHIDLRYDKNTNGFKVIEVNPRFWGSVEASLFAGVNFPYLYCASSLNYNFDIPKYKHIKFMNIWGLLQTIKKNKSYLFNLNFILNNTPIKYFFKDPKPLIYRFFNLFF